MLTCDSTTVDTWPDTLPADTYYIQSNGLSTSEGLDYPTVACAPPLYTISGKLFNDVNGDEKSTGDFNYTGDATVARLPASGIYNSPVGTGSYSFTNLPDGEYTVAFSGLPANLGFTFPYYNFGCPESARNCVIVKVGSCSDPLPGKEATCSNGSVASLNAGVTDIKDAWFQSIGADLRWDSGFNNPLPSSSAYASLPGLGGMPGIIFSGETSPSFGAGQASANPFNWQVGSFTNPDVFTKTHTLIPTSYTFLLETAQSSGITPAVITSLDGLTHGIYKVEGNLNVNSDYTFGSGNFIILVNGNLNIKKKILVPVGSTAIFSAKGNISVDGTVGEGTTTVCDIATHVGCSIEGLYSADNDFIAEGANSCPAIDKRLNIAGTVIANAWRQGGTFWNKRTLCAGNTANPSVSFSERPDFMLNYPAFVKQIPRFWREVAP